MTVNVMQSKPFKVEFPRTVTNVGNSSSTYKAEVILGKQPPMLDYETRYVMIEHFCLALVWATRRLRRYMIEYSVHLISCLDPLRYLFDRPALIG